MQVIIHIALVIFGAFLGVLFMCLVQIGAQADRKMDGLKSGNAKDREERR